MHLYEDLENKIIDCSIMNGYAHWSDLEKLVATNPDQAWRLIWKKQLSRRDPGRDEGTLACMLVKLATQCFGQDRLESFVIETWESVPIEIRYNLVEGFFSPEMYSLETVKDLFYRPSNTNHLRHRMLANIMSGREFVEAPEIWLEMADAIEPYREDNFRNLELTRTRFLNDIRDTAKEFGYSWTP